MALTKYIVILILVYLNFEISPINPAAIPDRSDSDIHEDDDTSTVNPETYSTTLTNDDDIGKIFESYENQYIKNSNWNDATLMDLKETEMNSKLKPINTYEDSTSRGTETTDPTVDDVVESIHNIIDEKTETKTNRTDRTIVVVVTTNVFNVNNGSDDAGKRQHTLLSFGTPGMIRKETSTDPTINLHNKITTEFFNSNPSPITSPSDTAETYNEGKLIKKDIDTTDVNGENPFDSEKNLSGPEDEKVVGTTEKPVEQAEQDSNDFVNNIDIRHLPDTENVDNQPEIVVGRNFDEILPNENSNDILRIMKIIPSRTEEEINSGSLSKPFEIPAQEPDSSLMEAIENILDTDVRKAFERDIPETRHVPLDINIEEEALYAPLKDLSEYIVEEIPINGNFDILKENYGSDDETMKKVEMMERLDEKVMEKYMDGIQDKNSSSKPIERVEPFEPTIESTDEEPLSTTTTVDATTKTTPADTTTILTTTDSTAKTTIVNEPETLQPHDRQIDETVPAEDKGTMTTLTDQSDEITDSPGLLHDEIKQSDNHEESSRNGTREAEQLPTMEGPPKFFKTFFQTFPINGISERTETSTRSEESKRDEIRKSEELPTVEGPPTHFTGNEEQEIKEESSTDEIRDQLPKVEELPRNSENVQKCPTNAVSEPTNSEESIRDEIREADQFPTVEGPQKYFKTFFQRFPINPISEQTKTSTNSQKQGIKDEDKIPKTSDLLETKQIVKMENDNISGPTKIPEEEVSETSENTASLDKDDQLPFSTAPTQQQDKVIPGSLLSMEADKRLGRTDNKEEEGAENLIDLKNWFYVPVNLYPLFDFRRTRVRPMLMTKPEPKIDVDDILRTENNFIDELLSYNGNEKLLRDIEFINERDDRFRDFRLKFAEEIMWSETRLMGMPVKTLIQDDAIEIVRVKRRKHRKYIWDIRDNSERNTEIKYENNLLDLLQICTNREQDEVPFTLVTIMNRFSQLRNERNIVVSAMNNYVANLIRLSFSDGGNYLYTIIPTTVIPHTQDFVSEYKLDHTSSPTTVEPHTEDLVSEYKLEPTSSPTTVEPHTEDFVSEIVKDDEETTEQHQVMKKPGVDGADNGEVEIKAIKVTNVVSNELFPAQSVNFKGRSFSDDDEPVDPLRTLVEGVELTAELTKTVDNFQSFTNPNSSIHLAANQVVENKEDMELVKNAEELNSLEDSIWTATARYVFIAGGVLLIGLIVLLGVFSIMRFRQFKRNILFSC